MKVAAPRLNQGMSGGIKQPSFGNFRDNDFSFPGTKLSAGQGPPAQLSQPRMTFHYPIFPPQTSWDKNWGTGTLYFMQKTKGLLKNMFCVSYSRTLMATMGIRARLDAKKPVDPNEQAADALLKPRQRNYGFMSNMERLMEEFDFAGVGFGDIEPGLQIGNADMGDSQRFSGAAKQVPLVARGHCFVPNLWETGLRTGQHLFIIMKPRLPGKAYYTATGDSNQMPTDIADTDTIPELIFYTHPENRPPIYCSDYSALLECKGGQPPLYDRSYIEWEVGPDKKTIVKGQLRDAVVWDIGRVYSTQSSRQSTGSRLAIKSTEPLAFTRDYRSFPMLEVQLDPQRVYV